MTRIFETVDVLGDAEHDRFVAIYMGVAADITYYADNPFVVLHLIKSATNRKTGLIAGLSATYKAPKHPLHEEMNGSH